MSGEFNLTPSFPFSGLILAGGQSRRMGQDKALLPLGGVTWLQHQAALLRSVGCEDVLVSGHAGVDYGISVTDVRVVADAFPDAGPLAGIAAGLGAARHPWVLVLAVDLPRLTPVFLQRLLAAGGGECGVVPQSPRGIEPLIALYPRALLDDAEASLRAGQGSVQAWAARAEARGLLRWLPLGDADLPLIANCNTPSDLADLA